MRKFLKSIFRSLITIKSLSSILMFIIITLGFYWLTGPIIFSRVQIKNFLTFGVEMSIMAMGVALLMISGEFDLSVGSVFALSGVTLFLLMGPWGLGPWISVLIVLLMCSFIGFLNGVITLKLNIPSFIVTLAGLMVWRATVLTITHGTPPPEPPGTESLINTLANPLMGEYFLTSFLIFVAILVGLWLLLERTPFGNHIFAAGGDVNFARKRGASPQKVKLTLFILASVLVGFAAILRVVRVGSAQPMMARGYELRMIAAAVIGGVSLFGGRGSLIGAVLGAFLLRVIRNGIVIGGISGSYYRLIIGAIILISVVVNRTFREKVITRFT